MFKRLEIGRNHCKEQPLGLQYRLNHLIKPNPFFKSSIFTEKTIKLSANIFSQQSGSEAPFFLFINFMEAHEKYRPPIKYRQFSRWSDKQQANMTGFYFQEKTPHFDELLAINRNLHDDEIYYLDQKIKDIFYGFRQNRSASRDRSHHYQRSW